MKPKLTILLSAILLMASCGYLGPSFGQREDWDYSLKCWSHLIPLAAGPMHLDRAKSPL